MSLSNLPDVVLLKIFSYLDSNSLNVLEKTESHWKDLILGSKSLCLKQLLEIDKTEKNFLTRILEMAMECPQRKWSTAPLNELRNVLASFRERLECLEENWRQGNMECLSEVELPMGIDNVVVDIKSKFIAICPIMSLDEILLYDAITGRKIIEMKSPLGGLFKPVTLRDNFLLYQSILTSDFVLVNLVCQPGPAGVFAFETDGWPELDWYCRLAWTETGKTSARFCQFDSSGELVKVSVFSWDFAEDSSGPDRDHLSWIKLDRHYLWCFSTPDIVGFHTSQHPNSIFCYCYDTNAETEIRRLTIPISDPFRFLGVLKPVSGVGDFFNVVRSQGKTLVLDLKAGTSEWIDKNGKWRNRSVDNYHIRRKWVVETGYQRVRIRHRDYNNDELPSSKSPRPPVEFFRGFKDVIDADDFTMILRKKDSVQTWSFLVDPPVIDNVEWPRLMDVYGKRHRKKKIGRRRRFPF